MSQRDEAAAIDELALTLYEEMQALEAADGKEIGPPWGHLSDKDKALYQLSIYKLFDGQKSRKAIAFLLARPQF